MISEYDHQISPDVVQNEFTRLIGSNPRDISKVADSLREWLVRQNGQAPEGLLNLIEKGDLVSAIGLLAGEVRSQIPIIGAPERVIRADSAKIRAAVSKQTLIKNAPSETFALGQSSHSMVESIVAAGGDLSQLVNENIDLNIKEGVVHGFSIVSEVKPVQYSLFDSEDIPVPEVSSIEFSEPLSIPGEEECVSEWAINVIEKSMGEIQFDGGLPEKPYDVEKLVTGPSRANVIKIVEVLHLIFETKGPMSAVEGNSKTFKKINFDKLDQFAILNWLSIARMIVDLNRNPRTDHKGIIFRELPEGDLLVQNGSPEQPEVHRVHRKKMDIVEFWFKEDPKKTIRFDQVGEVISTRFYSQERRHRRPGYRNGRMTDYSTVMGRSAKSFLRELRKTYGNAIFEELNITVTDFKFLGGDGGIWDHQFDPNNLPVNSHIEQVQGYLFKLAAQLYWIKKWSKVPRSLRLFVENDPNFDGLPISAPWEMFAISVDDVIEFATKKGLFSRITGELRYQLPGQEIIKEVNLDKCNREELVSIGRRTFGLKENVSKQLDRMAVVKTLMKIFGDDVKNLEVATKDPREYSEELDFACLEWRGGTYLCIDKLLAAFSEGKLSITNAIEFSSGGVKVFWAEGVPEIPGRLRIAVDSKGRFAIHNDVLGLTIGNLLSEVSMKGVVESSDKLTTIFNEKIWTKIGYKVFDDIVVEGRGMVFPNGEIVELVNGKPLICMYDLLTGVWHLDENLLKSYVATDAGKEGDWGFRKIYEVISSDKEFNGVSVYCPMPTHHNNDTQAAAYYGGSGSHIYCFGCRADIHVPSRNSGPRLELPHASGLKTVDYRSVSTEREAAFDNLMGLGQLFADSEVPREYLLKRGLTPDDLGLYGYLPTALDQALSILVKSPEFYEKYKLRRGSSILKEFFGLESAQELLDFLEDMDDVDKKARLLKIIQPSALTRMRQRKILGSQKLGGRLILPTYWVRPATGKLIKSNVVARGIDVHGMPKYNQNGPKHYKVPLVVGSKVVDGKKLRPTPTGFWIRDVEKFLTNLRDTVVVFEGPLNAATFARMRPDLADICITNTGVGFYELVAFLRWLGVDGDRQEDANHRMGLNYKLRHVVLACDYDLAGIQASLNITQKLQDHLGLDVSQLESLLPDDVLQLLPSDMSVDSFKEGGDFFKTKLDLNDLIQEKAPDSYPYYVDMNLLDRVRKRYGLQK